MFRSDMHSLRVAQTTELMLPFNVGTNTLKLSVEINTVFEACSIAQIFALIKELAKRIPENILSKASSHLMRKHSLNMFATNHTIA